MFKKKKMIGTLLFLSLSVQYALADGSIKATIGSPNKSINNGMIVNSDGSISVSGSSNTKVPITDSSLSQAGFSLSKEKTAKPSVEAFDNRTEPQLNDKGEFVVQGGTAGAQQMKELTPGFKGASRDVKASIGDAGSTATLEDAGVPGGFKSSIGNSPKQGSSNMTYQGSSGQKEKITSSGALLFQGGDNNAGKYTVEDSSNNQNNNTPTLKSFQQRDSSQDSIPAPIGIPSKVPVSVKDMPMPTSLPPLPGNSNSNGIALPIALPTSEAAALPPLPMDFIPNLNIQVGMPGDLSNLNGIPVNANGEPINYSGLANEAPTPDSTGVDDDWSSVMQDEADAMTMAGIPMKVVIVNTENVLMRKFIAQNILKTDKETFDGIDDGLSSVLSLQTKINSSYIPTCYIMFRKESLGSLKANVLDPYSQVIGKKATASFLIGHQIAHCMDNLERFKVLPKQNIWFANDAAKVGIAAPAMRRLYPYGMNYNQFSHTTMHFYQDIGQRQYQERIADIFGIFMTLNRGYSNKIINLVMKTNSGAKPTSPHDTNPALVGIEAKYTAIPKTNIQALWKGARDIQVMTGINSVLGDGAPDSVVKDNNMSSGKIYDNIKNTSDSTDKKAKKPKEQVNFDSVGKFNNNKNKPTSLFGSSKMVE